VLIPRKESNAMKTNITTATALPPPVLEPVLGSVDKAFEDVAASFDRFCLTAGIKALGEMMEKDAQEACGPRHSRGKERNGYRWGRTRGKIAFHAGKIEIERPRVRDFAGRELGLPSWENATAEDWLGKWAMNLMLLNVSTRKFRRAVRLPEGDVPAPAGSGVSKSAASRHFVAFSSARLREWSGADLSRLDILVVQIDGIHISQDMVLVAAIGIDGEGIKHPLALMEGATENAAVVQALIDSLLARGLDPVVPRLFIIDGSKALSRAIRRSFGRETAIQRCQIHKARNIMERLPNGLHASVRRALRQAWELDDADKAERLIRNLAQRLERDAPGVSGSLLEGLDEILTVTRLGLPDELRRSLACTNIIENMMGTIRRVSRNVKRWRSASMALRWAAAAMLEAKKGFRRLKAYKQLPMLRAALIARSKQTNTQNVDKQLKVA
jgi:putative transposase